jgi:hypothetical protein
MLGLETWEEIRARHKREKMQLVASLRDYKISDAASILQMREDTLRSFANYYGLSFVRKNARKNAAKTSRSANAKIPPPAGGQVRGRNIQDRPQPKRTQQPSTGAGGTAEIRGEFEEGRLHNMNIDKYQDLYRQAWIAQNKIDVKKNPLMEPKTTYSLEKAKNQGKLGGRPAGIALKTPKEQAEIRDLVVRGMKIGLTIKQTCELAQCSERMVRHIRAEMRNGS